MNACLVFKQNRKGKNMNTKIIIKLLKVIGVTTGLIACLFGNVALEMSDCNERFISAGVGDCHNNIGDRRQSVVQKQRSPERKPVVWPP